MIDQINLEQFNNIYNLTYDNTMKYIICKCSNIDDVNDIIQDVYYELYKNIHKNKLINVENINSYIIGIAKNIINKHYGILYKFKTISLFSEKDDLQLIDNIADDIDIPEIIINNTYIDDIWKYLKTKKIIIFKVFYLYYKCDIKIKDIAKELNISESLVKNTIYRTLKELNVIFKEDNYV